MVVSLKQLVIPASCLTCCRTRHRTLLHDLFHLPQHSSDHLLPHCPVLAQLLRNWIKNPCETHGGLAASPTGHEPNLVQSDDLQPRRIELDRNLGTDPSYHRRYKGIWQFWCRHALRPPRAQQVAPSRRARHRQKRQDQLAVLLTQVAVPHKPASGTSLRFSCCMVPRRMLVGHSCSKSHPSP